MIAEAHGIRLDVQPVQTSSLAAKSRAGGQPEYRALEDDTNIDLSAVVGVKWQCLSYGCCARWGWSQLYFS